MEKRAKEAAKDDTPFVDLGNGGVWKVETVEDYGDFEFYAEELRSKKGLSRSPISELRDSKSKLGDFTNSPTEIGKKEAIRFKKEIEEELAPQTAKQYIGALDRMAQFYVAHDYYEGNPFHGLSETIDASEDRNTSFQSSDRITVPNEELRAAVQEAHGSVLIVCIAIVLKSGIRVSEAVNLNWEDVHIDSKLAEEILPEPRIELDNKPDTIYIDPDVTEDMYDVESNGNKRKVGTHIPIDSELKKLLLWYRTVQPLNFGDHNPVLRNNSGSENPGGRMPATTFGHLITNWAREHGWHKSRRDEKENITPHWFRATFTTYMLQRLRAIDDDEFNENPKDLTKGLRGDVGQDVIEDYIMRYDLYSSYIRPRQFKIGIK